MHSGGNSFQNRSAIDMYSVESTLLKLEKLDSASFTATQELVEGNPEWQHRLI